MHDFLKRLNIMPALLAVTIFIAVGCDSRAPPPSPPASASSEGDAYSKSSSKNLSKSKDLDEDDEDDEKSSAFNFGGADFGEKEVIDAVKKCHDSEQFYNRFDDDEEIGKCTKLKLAKVDCDTKGLKKVLSDKQVEQFSEALSDESSSGYKGWTIDQCLDCAKGSDEDLCQNSSGKEQVGTKVFFLKEADSEITGKSMVLPVRPGQSKD